MKDAIIMPTPCIVMPATSMGRACLGGWEGAISAATVPQSIVGKMGRIQAGVIDWMVRGLPVKRKKYCPIAMQNVSAKYIQNRTRRTTTSQ